MQQVVPHIMTRHGNMDIISQYLQNFRHCLPSQTRGCYYTTNSLKSCQINFYQTDFFTSAFKPADFPKESATEIAFAGRSNVGKSSTLNLLTGQHKLAKVSKTPGRTRSINFFTLTENAFLVDLPGYGYAKVSHSVKANWEHFLQSYILKRQALKGIALVMDCRHPFTELDQVFLNLCLQGEVPCHVLLNKADKLSNNEKTNLLQKSVKPLLTYYPNLSFQFFSAVRGQGLDELKIKLSGWLQPNEM